MEAKAKKCTKCKEEKPVEAFRLRAGRPRSWCRSCEVSLRSAQFKVAYWENREAMLKKMKKRRDSRTPETRAREVACMTAWREKNKEYVKGQQRAKHLRLNYGLTVAEFDSMLEEQGGKCGACGGPPSDDWGFVVDHDHETGEVRGLLCRCCNSALGLMKDDVDSILNLAGYLQQHKPSERTREST